MIDGGQWFLAKVVENDRSEGVSLGLSGSTGAGKTHVARRIYKFLKSFSVDLILRHSFESWAMIWIDLPEMVEVDDEEDFQNKIYELNLAKFVVIDDVGAEADRFKNGAAASRLRRVLEVSEKKWVVTTTNMQLETLLDCYDARVADRLRAFHWCEVGDVPSYRPRLKEKRFAK